MEASPNVHDADIYAMTDSPLDTWPGRMENTLYEAETVLRGGRVGIASHARRGRPKARRNK